MSRRTKHVVVPAYDLVSSSRQTETRNEDVQSVEGHAIPLFRGDSVEPVGWFSSNKSQTKKLEQTNKKKAQKRETLTERYRNALATSRRSVETFGDAGVGGSSKAVLAARAKFDAAAAAVAAVPSVTSEQTCNDTRSEDESTISDNVRGNKDKLRHAKKNIDKRRSACASETTRLTESVNELETVKAQTQKDVDELSELFSAAVERRKQALSSLAHQFSHLGHALVEIGSVASGCTV